MRLGRKAFDVFHGEDQRPLDQSMDHQAVLGRFDLGHSAMVSLVEKTVGCNDPVELL